MFKPELPSNRMIFEVRRDSKLFTRFPEKLERLMTAYGLSEEEKEAWRAVDIRKLGDLGVHPYFLPQVTRLMHGSRRNDSSSEAAQAYRRSMVDGGVG